MRLEFNHTLPSTERSENGVDDPMPTELSKIAVPFTASVLDALSAPLMFKLLAKVLDAFAMRPPEESTRKSVCAVESVKRRKSPVKARVEEAKMRVPVVASVEVALTRSTALS